MQSSYFSDRLNDLISYYRLNKNSLSVKLGFTANTSITRLANHPDRNPSYEVIQLLLKTFPEISARWLVLGEGKMLAKEEVATKSLWTAYYKGNNWMDVLTAPEAPADRIRIHGYSDCDIALDVAGEAMTPRIKSGDIVLCRKVNITDPITFGEAYLLVTALEPIVRYIRNSPSEDKFKVGAENPRFEDYEIQKSDIMLLARVKGIIRRESV